MTTDWREVAQHDGRIVLTRGDATLLVESPQPHRPGDDPLRGAIARLAPHHHFGPAHRRSLVTQCMASTADGYIVVGTLARSATTMAYLLEATAPIDVDEVVAAYFRHVPSPFDYLAE